MCIRDRQLAAVKYVDEIVMYSTEKELEDLFLTLPLDVRILGEEYRDVDFTAKQICLDRNIELFYNTRDHSFSSTSLRQRILETQIEQVTRFKQAVMPEVRAQQEEIENEQSEKGNERNKKDS